jgi:hypothetical protein
LIQNKSDSVDWIMTITFYYALHFVQAKLERDFRVCPTRHTNKDPKLCRRKCVIKYLPNVSRLYNNLYNESMKARYTEQGVYRDNKTKTLRKLQSLISEAKRDFPALIQ